MEPDKQSISQLAQFEAPSSLSRCYNWPSKSIKHFDHFPSLLSVSHPQSCITLPCHLSLLPSCQSSVLFFPTSRCLRISSHRLSSNSIQLKLRLNPLPPVLTSLCPLSVNWRHIHWPSFSKGENKGSVLLWYSCYDRSILMFLMREGLQCRISILKHCLMKLWNDINQLTFVFPFAVTRSIDVSWPRKLTRKENDSIQYNQLLVVWWHWLSSSMKPVIWQWIC